MAVDPADEFDRAHVHSSDDDEASAAAAAPSATAVAGYEPPEHRAILASAPSFFVPPPFGWRHPITGKHGWQLGFELIAFGMYVKRARYLVGISQVKLAAVSGVDQGQISRLERALAPWTRTEDLVSIGSALGRAFPLGFCPHEHGCHWQPGPPPPQERPWLEKWREAEERLGRGPDDER